MRTPKTLFENRWLSLKETEGYIFSHESRCQGNIVAILVYDSSKPDMVLGRYERCPAHFDGIQLASFTGGVEKGDVLATAVMEIKEEAGYDAKKEELIYLGTCRPSKSSDTVVHLVSWDANGKIQGEASGDGSEGEKDSYSKWIDKSVALSCQDPLMLVLLVRKDYVRNA